MNQEQQLAAVKQFTVNKLANDRTGHGMDHINRVVKTLPELLPVRITIPSSPK